MNELILIAALWPAPALPVDGDLRPAAALAFAPDAAAAAILLPLERPSRFEFGVGSHSGVAILPRRIAAPIVVPGIYADLARLPTMRLGFTGFDAALGFRPDRLPGALVFQVHTESAGARSLMAGLVPDELSILHSSASALFLDLTYTVRPQLGPLRMELALGGRFGHLEYKREAMHLTLVRQIETTFTGGGPGVGVGLSLPFRGRFGPFVRVDGGVMFGKARQRFDDSVYESVYPGGAPGNVFVIIDEETDREPEGRFLVAEGRETQAEPRTVPYLSVLVGFTLVDPGPRNRSVQCGYQFEQIWDPFSVGASAGHLTTHGFVVRWTFNY